MGRLAKAVLVLAILGMGAFVAYAYYPGTLRPDIHDIDQPVTLNVD